MSLFLTPLHKCNVLPHSQEPSGLHPASSPPARGYISQPPPPAHPLTHLHLGGPDGWFYPKECEHKSFVKTKVIKKERNLFYNLFPHLSTAERKKDSLGGGGLGSEWSHRLCNLPWILTHFWEGSFHNNDVGYTKFSPWCHLNSLLTPVLSCSHYPLFFFFLLDYLKYKPFEIVSSIKVFSNKTSKLSKRSIGTMTGREGKLFLKKGTCP